MQLCCYHSWRPSLHQGPCSLGLCLSHPLEQGLRPSTVTAALGPVRGTCSSLFMVMDMNVPGHVGSRMWQAEEISLCFPDILHTGSVKRLVGV